MKQLFTSTVLHVAIIFASSCHGFSIHTSTQPQSLKINKQSRTPVGETAPTLSHKGGRPMQPELVEALERNYHPEESQDELGKGVFVATDWRKAWWTYESPPEDPTLIHPDDGYSQYTIDEIDGTLPLDLSGTLYRNGPGKFGVNGHRVAHFLDADGLVMQVTIPPPSSSEERTVTVQSRFIQTNDYLKEQENNQFMVRGTFGTGPLGSTEGAGVNEEPAEPSMLTKLLHRGLKLDIKNTANTHVVAFGGKLLALFEAGLPYRLNPATLETIGEDDMGGLLPRGKKPVRVAAQVESLGGAAHTAHPKVCPRTGNLVGWSWTQLPQEGALELTITEWSPVDFSKVASTNHRIPNCSLAPHDIAITENYVVFIVNALEMDPMNLLSFVSGLKGPAASLTFHGKKPIKAWIFPRPTKKVQDEPRVVENIPPSFCVHTSHAYEDTKTGNIITYFAGWPESDSKEFLSAWGGFCPQFNQIPPSHLWRLDLTTAELNKVCPTLCCEQPVVHPNIITAPKYTYVVASNNVGDSSPPCGYARVNLDANTSEQYWFGTRYFCGEPLVVPKRGRSEEEAVYVLGMVLDSARQRSFVAIFDMEQPLAAGPVCKLWFKSAIPHGLHGCFDPGSNERTSYFS